MCPVGRRSGNPEERHIRPPWFRALQIADRCKVVARLRTVSRYTVSLFPRFQEAIYQTNEMITRNEKISYMISLARRANGAAKRYWLHNELGFDKINEPRWSSLGHNTFYLSGLNLWGWSKFSSNRCKAYSGHDTIIPFLKWRFPYETSLVHWRVILCYYNFVSISET